MKTGQRINTALLDILTGRFLFRHHSQADDAAKQMEKSRAQDRANRANELAAMDRFNRALGRLEEHIR